MQMRKCPECGGVLTQEMLNVNMCWECGKILDESMLGEKEKKEIEKQASENNPNLKYEKLINKIMLTTGYDFETNKIVGYLGVISGGVVLGTGFLSEYRASFSDFFGIESNSFANKLEEAKEAATVKLLEKALSKGANAVIGLDFDYITLGNNMIGVSANGTAVIIDKE